MCLKTLISFWVLLLEVVVIIAVAPFLGIVFWDFDFKLDSPERWKEKNMKFMKLVAVQIGLALEAIFDVLIVGKKRGFWIPFTKIPRARKRARGITL